MDKKTAVKVLQQQIDKIDSVNGNNIDLWFTDTRQIIRNVTGDRSEYLKQFLYLESYTGLREHPGKYKEFLANCINYANNYFQEPTKPNFLHTIKWYWIIASYIAAIAIGGFLGAWLCETQYFSMVLRAIWDKL